MRVFNAGASVRVDGDGCRGGGEQSAALNQFLFADAIGEEAEVADADQSGRQHVEQEAADELDRRGSWSWCENDPRSLSSQS